MSCRPISSSLCSNTSPHVRGQQTETAIQLFFGTAASRQVSPRLPMRLDTGAFMSFLPEEWFRNPQLQQFLGVSSGPMTFRTATAQGTGELYCDLRVGFEHDTPSNELLVDCLVTPTLNGRGYGLLPLNDVLKHFVIQPEGELLLGSDQQPTTLPILVLIPWPSPAAWICYRCPQCEVCAWGRPRVRLRCDDCGLLLDVVP